MTTILLCDECGEYWDWTDEHPHVCADLEPFVVPTRAFPIVPMDAQRASRNNGLKLPKDPHPNVYQPQVFKPEGMEPAYEDLHLLWWSLGALELGVRANLWLADQNSPRFAGLMISEVYV